MSTRAYDYRLTLAGIAPFNIGNTVIGLSSNTVAEIIDSSPTELKVKLANTSQQFILGESLVSNTAILRTYNVFIDHSSNITGSTNVFALPATYSLVGQADAITVYVEGVVAPRDTYVINSNSTIQFLPVDFISNTFQAGSTEFSDIRETTIFPTVDISTLNIQVVTGNVEAASFVSANFEGTVLTANSAIIDINDSPYIAEKNAVEQSAVVKLYSIYYPGEWYPPNNSGNPSNSGTGFPWPYGFPIRYAEVLGDDYYFQDYTVSYGGTPYTAKAVESDNIQIDAAGRIGEITLSISNFDGSISSLVENKNILGYNSTRSTQAIVNGELVQNIDPRTVSSNIFFSSSVQASRGINAAWDYESTISTGDTWTPLRSDSRDLTGAVVDIVVTYAKFLDYWPEYSLTKSLSATDTVSSALFLGSFSVQFQVTDPRDVFFSSDGSRMYLIGQASSQSVVVEYSLSTAWDISSTTFIRNFNIQAQETSPQGLFFKPDGFKMYVVGANSDSVHEYALSSAWNISTATYTQSFSVATQEIVPTSLHFKPDGLKMYIAGIAGGAVYEYDLSTAWNISTAVYVQNFIVPSISVQGLFFNSEGTFLYIVDAINPRNIVQYLLSTPWDISTAAIFSTLSLVSISGDTNPSGVFLDTVGAKLYIMGDGSDSVYEYILTNGWDVYTSSVYRVGDILTSNNTSNTSEIISIDGDTLVLSNTRLGSLTVDSPLYIVNPDADSSAHIKHTFVINSLEELDEIIAKFSLTNWLQYFKNTVPKRKFYATTCPFVYKGDDCKYPASGVGTIVGSNPPVQANGFFTFGNVSTVNVAEDICPKTLTACKLRKNLVNFGGFPNAQ